MAWAKEGSTTASGATDNLQIDTTSKKFNFAISHVIPDTGNISLQYRLDNDSGSNYAFRSSDNGGTDGTATSFDIGLFGVGINSTPIFGILYAVDIDGEEKLSIGFGVVQRTAGATTAPQRRESVSKYNDGGSNTQATRFDAINYDTGDWGTNSNCMLMGTD